MNMIILCADDFGLTEGVSRGICELAAAGRLSATSALVTTRAWPSVAEDLGASAHQLATGLHLNLTLGSPLTRMQSLAPEGILPAVGTVARRALLRSLNHAELVSEINAQLDCFVGGVGRLPDHIDGHQHVHALPQVRVALIEVVGQRNWQPPPLIRVPADSLTRIAARGQEITKSTILCALASGSRQRFDIAGLPTNDTFSGVTSFSRRTPYEQELSSALRKPGRRHIIMCHPGRVDDELHQLDPVVERREDEFKALMADESLPSQIWHPVRQHSEQLIDWSDH